MPQKESSCHCSASQLPINRSMHTAGLAVGQGGGVTSAGAIQTFHSGADEENSYEQSFEAFTNIFKNFRLTEDQVADQTKILQLCNQKGSIPSNEDLLKIVFIFFWWNQGVQLARNNLHPKS